MFNNIICQEFNNPCPNTNEKATGARLGGQGPLVSHMVGVKKNVQAISPDFTGFYWILPDFTDFNR